MITDILTSTPLTKKVLAEKLGTDVRSVELMIQEARLAGWPILSNSDGYWLSRDPQQVKACAERLRSRALTQLETAGALAKAAERLSGPLDLGLVA